MKKYCFCDIKNLLRKITASVVLMWLCAFMWSGTYYWVDVRADGSGNYWWNFTENWVSDPATKTGNPASAPSTGDTIIFDKTYFTNYPSPLGTTEINVDGITIASGVDFTCKSLTTTAAASTITGKLTVTGDVTFGGTASVTGTLTSGGKLTFNDTASISSDLSATGNIAFNGDVTYTGGHGITSGGDISINCDNFTNDSTIRFYGNLKIEKTAAFGNDIIVSKNFTDTAGISSEIKITLNGSSTAQVVLNKNSAYKNLVIYKDSGVSVKISGEKTLDELTVTQAGSVQIDGTITAGQLTASKGSFTVGSGGNLTINGASSVKDNFSNYGTVNLNGVLTLNSSFTDSGTWSDGTDGEILINGTGDQYLRTGSSTYKKITENKTSGNLYFSNDVKATDFVIQSGSQTYFNGDTKIATFTDSSSAGNIYFNGGGTITNAVTFNTTGTVSFGDGSGDSFSIGSASPYAALTHTAGSTKVTGTLKAGNISFSDLTIGNEAVLLGTDISCGEISGTTGTLTVTNSGTFTTASGKNISVKSFTQNGDGSSSLGGNLTASGGDISFAKGAEFTSSSAVVSAAGKTITFSDLLTGSGNLQLTAADIKTKGNVNAGGTVTYTGNSAVSANITSSGAILINGNLLSDGNSSTYDGGTVTVNGKLTVTKNTADSSTTVKKDLTAGEVEITSGKLITESALKVTGALTCGSNGKVTVSASGAQIEGSLSNAGTFTANGTVSVKGIFSDTGTWSDGTDGEILINGTSDQSFTAGSSTYKKITEDKAGGNLTFSNDVKSSQIIIKKGRTTTFSGKCETAAYSDYSAAGEVLFNGGGTITNAVTFNTTGTVSFGDDSGDNFSIGSASPYAALTHTAGNTKVTGILNAGDISFSVLTLDGTINGNSLTAGVSSLKGSVSTTAGQIYSDKVSLSGDTAVTSSSGSSVLKFQGKISGNYELSVNAENSSGIVKFSEIDIKNLNIGTASNIEISGTVKTSDTLKIPRPVTAKTENLEIQANVETVSGTPLSPAPSFTGNSASGINNLKITGYFVNGAAASINELTLTVGEGVLCKAGISTTGNGSLYVTKDFVVTADSSVSVPVTAKNIVLYSGTLSVQADFTSTGDVVLFGASYSASDSQTGVSDAYKYDSSYGVMNNHKYTATVLPDGTDLPSVYSGVLNCAAGIKIQAAENFYANGITASSTGNWNLLLKQNKNVLTNFAYAVKCNFSSSEAIIGSYESGAAADGVRVACEEMSASDVDSSVESDGWDLDDFILKSNTSTSAYVYTIDDDVIALEFTYAPRNAGGELNTNIARITNSGGSYSGLFTDWTCTSSFASGATDGLQLYIKSLNTWNTDATGTEYGQADTDGNYNSTDAEGNHKTVVPYLNVPRDTSDYCYFITDLWGKRLRNYSGTGTYGNYTDVKDCTGPVLYSVRTGQENHETTAAAQKDYDSHNFIEFRYSERVDLGSSNASLCDVNLPYSAYSSAVNIPVTDKFGAVKGDITAEGAFTLAGLGSITNGKLYTGKNGNPDKYVNTLYRPDEYSIRIELAALTEGTITYDGASYKNWTGYIESAVMPSGAVGLPASGVNNLVKDWKENPQKMCRPSGLTVNSTTDGVYGLWDIEEPEFAMMKMSGPAIGLEAVGNGSGSALNRVEIHIFDNKGDGSIYADGNAVTWYTERGWVYDGTDTLYQSAYCADVFGGARPFSTDASNRTSGGLRICTLYDQQSAFRYGIGDNSAAVNGFNSITAGADSSVFTGASSPRRAVPLTADNLYYKLGFTQAGLPVKTTFTVSYDSSSSYITDLAGNRLRGKTGNTIDRTSPSYNIVVSPLSQNKIVLSFSKAIRYSGIVYNGSVIPEAFQQIIPYCFEIGTIDGSGAFTVNTGDELQINSAAPAEIPADRNTSDYSCFELTLNRNITLDDVENCYIRIKNAGTVGGNVYDQTSRDPITNLANCYVTFIQDSIGNYLAYHEAHGLSDFVVNGVTPLYAYEPDLTYDGKNVFDGLYENGSWAVHNFNRDQQNYGSLPQGYGVNIAVTSEITKKLRLYISSSPTAGSVSSKFNSNFNTDLRIWLPSVGNSFDSFAYSPNYNFDFADGDENLLFQIPQSVGKKWQSGQTASFLFGILDDAGENVTVVHTPYLNSDYITYDMTDAHSPKYPLYVVRLTNSSDLLSLDLWSIKIQAIKNQRGGVTILNNVINVTKGEKTVLKLNAEEEGNITVTVMTLDGNIVKYLNRGKTSEGEHYFTWDGTNKSGMTVARGMYFIRVSGNNIDETRKVMVVKE